MTQVLDNPPIHAKAAASPAPRRLRPVTIVAIVVVAVMAVLPLFVESFTLSNYRDVLLLALFALGLDVFWGRTGILSFGHATFFGLGAYGMAVATIRFGIDPAWASLVGLAAGVGVAAAVAFVVGFFILYGGVRGAYFTIVTLALTMIANQVAVGWSAVTGGDSGLLGVPPFSVLGVSFDDPVAGFYLALALLSACLFLSLWILNGRAGLILAAIRDDEIKARTLGYRTQFVLLATFVVSAAMAGLAGAIYATGTGFVAPDLIAILLSTEVIVWVAVGGSGTLVGPVIGTIVVWQLQERISSINYAVWPIAIGTFFILLVLVFPDGLPAYIVRLARRLRGGKGGES
jgi:ABC-type branched-subunit amino acid transport system permease subunit